MKKTLPNFLFTLIICAFLSAGSTTLNLQRNLNKKDVYNTFQPTNSDFTLIDNSYKDIYLMNYQRWSKTEYNYEYRYYNCNVSKLNKYVDIPIKNIYTQRVPAYRRINFATQLQSETTTTYADTYQQIYEVFEEVKHNVGFKDKKGFKIGGETIGLNFNFAKNSNIEFTYGISFKNSIENSITKSQTYIEIVSQEHDYFNAKPYDIWLKLCYRQKFNLYKIVFDIFEPRQIANDRGIHGIDYTYTTCKTTQETYYFLTPSNDSIYFDKNIYHMDENGEKVNEDFRIENNIIYL